MNVLFVPNWSNGNPYQDLLMDSLRANDVRIGIDNYPKAWPILFNIFREHKDKKIVHLHWLGPYMDWLFWTKAGPYRLIKYIFFIIDILIVKLLGKKIVWTVHNKFNHETLGDHDLELRVRRTLAKYADRILVHSPSVIEAIKDAYGLKDTSKFSVIEHGHYIDSYKNEVSRAQAREELGIAEDEIVFLNLGSIRPYKGSTQLIDTFINDDKLSKVRLILAGKAIDKDYESQVKALTEKSSNIDLYFEFVDEDRVQLFMNAADVCVFPFEEILTSGSVILAMSFGKAVIVPKKGCLVDLLDEKGAEFFSDIDDLASAAHRIVAKDLGAMGKHNFAQIKKYDWNTIGEKLSNIYKEIT